MSLEKESRAFEALQRLLKQAEACRTLFDEAGLDYPAPLQRMLGMGGVSYGIAQATPGFRIGPPPQQSRPRGAEADWVAVPIEGMMVQTAVMAILRQHRALPIKSIVGEFDRIGLQASAGSIANVGTRLESQGIIQRSKERGWQLVDESHAPILNGEYVWAPRDHFTKHELAARRREAIKYLLKQFRGGLQNLQILECLQALEWLQTPLSKDLVKMDMEELQSAGLVRRSGNSKKWVLAG